MYLKVVRGDFFGLDLRISGGGFGLFKGGPRATLFKGEDLIERG